MLFVLRQGLGYPRVVEDGLQLLSLQPPLPNAEITYAYYLPGFGGTGDWAQDFLNAKQAVYQENHIPCPTCRFINAWKFLIRALFVIFPSCQGCPEMADVPSEWIILP